jgi:hypothetical protein
MSKVSMARLRLCVCVSSVTLTPTSTTDSLGTPDAYLTIA